MSRSLLKPSTWFSKRPPEVAVLRLYGAIGPSGRFSPGLSHAPMEQAIEKAFASPRTKAVALAINSPGGSPSQSGLLARHIRRRAEETGKPVLAFCEDVAASGGYLLACAADEIFVDEYTVAGSIGVISASFGATEAIHRIGVERRVHTAGERKQLMDPFRPETEEDRARLDRLLKTIHARFIDWVKERRGAKLGDDPNLFEADVWVGPNAVEVGLVDAVGHMRDVLRERYGEDVRLREHGRRRPSLLARLFGRGAAAPGGVHPSSTLAGEASTALVAAAVAAVEERAAWGRYGL